MRINDNLPPNTYYQSYLYKAGIRFDVNFIDTVCNKGLGILYYAILLMVVMLSIIGSRHLHVDMVIPFRTPLVLVGSLYVLYYSCRLIFCKLIRAKLRKDLNPIIVEAYAVVILDGNREQMQKAHVLKPRKAIVLYKECGTLKPRFFTSSVRDFNGVGFIPDQMARVFIDRKNHKLYTVDDKTALATVSKKQKSFVKNALNEPVAKVGTSIDCKVQK